MSRQTVEGEIVTRIRLTQKQELFAQLYATEREFFGNGVAAYVEAYQPNRTRLGWYNVACSRASQLLSNVKVCERINQLLDQNGFNDQNVDKQLNFLIVQHGDLKTKLGAIREYNKLKQRVTERIEHEIKLKPVEVMQVDNGDKPKASTNS